MSVLTLRRSCKLALYSMDVLNVQPFGDTYTANAKCDVGRYSNPHSLTIHVVSNVQRRIVQLRECNSSSR